ncbi:MAG: M28 family peptidase [Flavobacteriales bacterium]
MGKRIAVFLLGLLALSSCKDELPDPPKVDDKPVKIERVITPQFNPDSAYNFIQKQVDFGPRVPNSKAHLACAAWLDYKLQSFGAKTLIQKGVVTAFTGEKLNIQNIIGQFSPEKSKRILLFAHWDTRPVADKDTKDTRKPIDGANDGGSGVGVLLEMARQFSLKEPKYGVDIIFFDAEDYGTFTWVENYDQDSWCLGSQYWGKNPPIANYNPNFGILLDMVGEKEVQFKLEAYSMQFAPQLMQKVWKKAGRLGYSHHFVNQRTGPITDDHLYVNTLANIPSIDIIGMSAASGGFGDYHHTHEDNMDIIDKNSLKAVGQTVMEIVYQEK